MITSDDIYEAINDIQETKERFIKKFKNDLELTGWSVITDWYDDYNRGRHTGYDPQGSLYKSYKIKVDDNGYLISFPTKFMNKFKHHQRDEKILYHNVFELGYHGGSWGKGLGEKVPHWRMPAPSYSEWMKNPAAKSFSPDERLHEEFQKVVDESKEKVEKDLLRIIKRLQRKRG